MLGSFSRSTASRIHIAVCGSTGPSDRYSAMPSMNHSGIREDPGAAPVAVARIVARDVELKRVHQLVAEHVVGLRQRPGQRQHDAALEGLGDAAGALPDQPFDGVGLPEVRRRGVENHGLAAAQLVLEEPRQAGVPSLGHARRRSAAASASSG